MDNTQTIDVIKINTKSKEKVKSKKLYFAVKRLFDILISLIGMVFIIPITIIIKIVSLITGDTNKIFFTQERIGKNGKIFKLYKYRSMIVNADEELKKILKKDKKLAKEYKENKKLHNDPRITRVGKFIRKFSIDELPQFINVIKGDMSIIGPRPYLPREKKDMKEYYDIVIKAKPGLTGLWQVSGRSDVSFEKRLELDEEYEKIKGLKTDSKIFFRTFSAVFGKKGAK